MNDVVEFDSDGDEIEEILVHLNFPDFENLDFINAVNINCLKLHNIDTPNPSIRFKGMNFAGKHSINLGSQLFFANDQKPEEKREKGNEGRESTASFLGATVSCINFQLESIDEPVDEEKKKESKETEAGKGMDV